MRLHQSYRTKDEFRSGLMRCGLTVDEFSALVGRSTSAVYRYGVTSPVPFYARLCLFLLERDRDLVQEIYPHKAKIRQNA